MQYTSEGSGAFLTLAQSLPINYLSCPVPQFNAHNGNRSALKTLQIQPRYFEDWTLVLLPPWCSLRNFAPPHARLIAINRYLVRQRPWLLNARRKNALATATSPLEQEQEIAGLALFVDRSIE